MRKRWCLAIAIGVIGLARLASAQWNQDGERVPDEPWRKESNGFGAMLMVTDDPKGFVQQWENPDPEFKPTLSTAKSARRGSTVVAVVVFSGCKENGEGHCDADLDLILLRPDGTVYGERKQVELWKNRPTPPNQNLQLSVGNLAFRVEPNDPLGKYTVQAVVRDRVAGVELALSQTIEVLPAP